MLQFDIVFDILKKPREPKRYQKSKAEMQLTTRLAKLGETPDQWAARMGASAEVIADLAKRRHYHHLTYEWVTKTAETKDRLFGRDPGDYPSMDHMFEF